MQKAQYKYRYTLTVQTVVALFLQLISVITVLHLNTSKLSAGNESSV